jgi:hypothetical protein
VITGFVTAFLTALVVWVVTRAMDRRENTVTTETVNNFTCPYCTIEVTGAKQLDLINHIPCINKAETDLEAMRKASVKKKKDEYFVDYSREVYTSSGNGKIPVWFNQDITNYEIGGTWWVVVWTLYRNGEQIHKNYAKTQANATAQAKKHIELDEYKRRNNAS